MQYRKLGESGLKVSPLCLGTLMYGGPTPTPEALAMTAAAKDIGINFIDTADIYNQGASEQVVGEAIKSQRDWWIVATKVCGPMGEGPNSRGLSRKWLMTAVDDSLSRLNTDYIDIYYLHRDDPDTPLEETVRTLADLVQSGKIRHFGLSNFWSWQVAKIAALCDSYGIDRPIASQPYYNAMNRMPEVEHIPACVHFGLGIVPYSPLARGVLTAKYSVDAPPPSETRAGRADKRMMQTEWRPESLKIAQILKQHAEARGITVGQFAVAWVLNNRDVTAPIAGPRTMAQWQDYVGALDYTFTAEDEALVDQHVPIGHPSTPGYHDPQYPITGRRTYSG